MTKKQQKWWIPELPSAIIIEILSRAPVKTIFNCRRVCKEWLSLISDPHFVNLHLSRSPACLILKLLYRNLTFRQLRLIDLQKPGNSLCYSTDSQLKLKSKINYRLMNSCNGLLCLHSDVRCFICNPILVEFFSFWLPGIVDPCDSVSLLGFISRTNQYKVVQFYHELDSNVVLARISTFGEKPWKELGPIPYPLTNQAFTALVNGAFHWIVRDEASKDLIHSFDFDKEIMAVGVLDDCLVLGDSSSPLQIDVWVMREYGVKESWRREFVIGTSRCILDYYEPVTLLRCGEVVLFSNIEGLVVYNPKALDGIGLKRLNIHGIGSYSKGIVHVPSFVSLIDVPNGESTLHRRIYLPEKAAWQARVDMDESKMGMKLHGLFWLC